jgi:AcrR family transcriptional regulator
MKSNNETKQKLIDVTRQMIDKNGIDSVSMRDLGTEMGLSRGAVYRHFKNKEYLLAAIATEDFEIINSRICELIGQIDDPIKLIYAILYAYYDFGINNREHYHLMFRKQWDREEYFDLHLSAFKLFKLIEKCLGKAHEQKCDIRTPQKQLTGMVLAFIQGLIELNSAGHQESEKGLDDPTGLINSFVDLIFA